jgi:NADH:ubiquinone oxidoreductase subunit K
LFVDEVILVVTGTILLLLGIASVAYSKNLIKSMMAFQAAVFGANLVLFSSGLLVPLNSMEETNVFVTLSILVGAAVEAAGLAIIVSVYRKYGTLNPAEIRGLRS